MRESTFRIAEKEEEYRAKRVLAKAKKIEQERIEQGWRWFEIDKQTKILVPCEDTGKPTEKGKIMIEAEKNALLL